MATKKKAKKRKPRMAKINSNPGVNVTTVVNVAHGHHGGGNDADRSLDRLKHRGY